MLLRLHFFFYARGTYLYKENILFNIMQLWDLQCYQFCSQILLVLYILVKWHFPKCITTLYLSKLIPLLLGNLLQQGIINQSCSVCSNSAWQVILPHLNDHIHSECLHMWYRCIFAAPYCQVHHCYSWLTWKSNLAISIQRRWWTERIKK